MALKGLKLIQNGNITYVPYNAGVVKYWQEWNQRVQKSRDAEKHLVTIDTATPDEVDKFLYPKAVKSTFKSPIALSMADENARLREENNQIRNELSDLKSMMLKFMAQKEEEANDEEDEFADIMTKRKPGRPPKNS